MCDPRYSPFPRLVRTYLLEPDGNPEIRLYEHNFKRREPQLEWRIVPKDEGCSPEAFNRASNFVAAEINLRLQIQEEARDRIRKEMMPPLPFPSHDELL